MHENLCGSPNRPDLQKHIVLLHHALTIGPGITSSRGITLFGHVNEVIRSFPCVDITAILLSSASTLHNLGHFLPRLLISKVDLLLGEGSLAELLLALLLHQHVSLVIALRSPRHLLRLLVPGCDHLAHLVGVAHGIGSALHVVDIALMHNVVLLLLLACSWLHGW